MKSNLTYGLGPCSVKAAVRSRGASKRVGSGSRIGPRASSAKVFDTEKPIPATDLADMREAGVLAPSKPRRQKASAKSRQPRPNDAVTALVRRGWRYFECCGEWKLPTRDYLSPSGEDCPQCGEWTFPHHGEPDASLTCDAMGNLLPMSFYSKPNTHAETGPRQDAAPKRPTA